MLKINNLTKKFNDRTIIDNLSFEVEDSEILTIVGPSGAGKTTLLRCISGLEPVDKGEFYLNNKKFSPYEDTGSESVIGVVFQDFKLLENRDVLENVAFAQKVIEAPNKKRIRTKSMAVLAMVGLAKKIKFCSRAARIFMEYTVIKQ